MHFTRRTEIALGMLAECARHSGTAITTQQVAERIGVKKQYAAKTASMLVRNGLLKSVTDPEGGLRIAVDPATVTLGKVIRITQPDLVGATATRRRGNYAIQAFNELVDAATQKFISVAEQYTVADLKHLPLRSNRSERQEYAQAIESGAISY